MFSAIGPAWNINNMRPYFERTRKHLADISYSRLTICLTNEVLSLDSAVSAFTFALFLYWWNLMGQKKNKIPNDDIFIALFDADRETFISRTDIYRLFTCHCITSDFLYFRDDFDFKSRVCHTPTNVIMINHHVLAEHSSFMSCFVKEIISHRPFYLSQKFPGEDLPLCFPACGACATVITKKCQGMSQQIGKAAWDFFCTYKIVVDMLHTAIIDETENMLIKNTSILDEKTMDFLEVMLKYKDIYSFRKKKYSILAEARRELANVTAMQMLKRDTRKYFDVIVSALPILVKDFLEKPDAHIAVQGALRVNHCHYILLLGSDKPYGCITEKDLAVYHGNSDKATDLGIYLERWSTPGFGLISQPLNCHPCFFYYKQLNLDASRKEFLLVLKEFVHAMEYKPQDLTTCLYPQDINKLQNCPPGYKVRNIVRELYVEDGVNEPVPSSSECPPGYHWKYL